MSKLPEVLTLLRTLVENGLRTRDILSLAAIAERPGISSHQLYQALGLCSHTSTIHSNERLMKHGLIEDRRVVAAKGRPSFYYVTEYGQRVLDDLWAVGHIIKEYHARESKEYDL